MALTKRLFIQQGNLDKDQQKELSSKIKELTGGAGANVVYDPVGDAYSEPCIRATAWDGRYLVIVLLQTDS